MRAAITVGFVVMFGIGVAMAQGPAPAPAEPTVVKVGDMAPDFNLPGTDGKNHKLSDYRGKQAVVIAWFPKAFTGGCTIECKSLRDSGEAIREFDVAYFAASCDDAETNRKFAESLGVDFPILSDPDKGTAAAYGVLHESGNFSMRWTFYIDREGIIQKVDRAVKPAASGQQVAATLAELGFPKRSAD